MDSRAVVTVCISTKNRASMLDDLFAALIAQDAPFAFEVAITDNGSTDGTAAALKRLQDAAPFPVHVARNDVPGGPAAGRNLAAAHAATPLLAFTDDDCRPDPHWLRNGVAALGTSPAVVVGRVRPMAGASHPMGRVVSSDHWRFFTTSNVFYRSVDFRAAGGFDTAVTGLGGEDSDLGWRVCKAGAEPRYAPDAVVYHPARSPSVRVTLKEALRWHGVPRFVKKHPEQRELLLEHRVFWRSHQWAVLALAAVALTPLTRLFLVGVAPWFWVRVWRTRRRDRARNLLYAPVFALRDTLEVAAMIRGSIRERTFVL